jgi:hypothetical protein
MKCRCPKAVNDGSNCDRSINGDGRVKNGVPTDDREVELDRFPRAFVIPKEKENSSKNGVTRRGAIFLEQLDEILEEAILKFWSQPSKIFFHETNNSHDLGRDSNEQLLGVNPENRWQFAN